jgi:hypothetical protein
MCKPLLSSFNPTLRAIAPTIFQKSPYECWNRVHSRSWGDSHTWMSREREGDRKGGGGGVGGFCGGDGGEEPLELWRRDEGADEKV